MSCGRYLPISSLKFCQGSCVTISLHTAPHKLRSDGGCIENSFRIFSKRRRQIGSPKVGLGDGIPPYLDNRGDQERGDGKHYQGSGGRDTPRDPPFILAGIRTRPLHHGI